MQQEDMQENIDNVLAPREAIMGFCGFLASIGINIDLETKSLTGLIGFFSDINGLPECRENWTSLLNIPEFKIEGEENV